MIKLRKKTLSVLLCLTLLASVIVVGFVTPAMALTSTAETPSNRKVQISFDDYATGTFSETGLTGTAHSSTIETKEGTDDKYLKVTSTGDYCRMTFDQLKLLKSDKKYYIAFDAKTDVAGSLFNMAMGPAAVSSWRIMFEHKAEMNHKEALAASNSKFYVDGTEVTDYDAFNASLSSEWQSFGFILNLDTAVWDNRTDKDVSEDDNKTYINYGSKKAQYWYEAEENGGNHLYFGAAYNTGAGKSVCYDNIVIYEMDVYDDAVPEIQYGTQEVTQSATLMNKDMTATSGYTFKTYGTGSMAQHTTDPEYGDVLKITSGGAFTFKTDAAVFAQGKKYTISFDAMGTHATGIRVTIGRGDSAYNSAPQCVISDWGATKGVQTANLYGAFKFYIDGVEVTDLTTFKLSTEWRNYKIEFDYTNKDFLDYYSKNIISGTGAGGSGALLTAKTYNLWIGVYYGNVDRYMNIDNVKIDTIATEIVEVGNEAGDTYISNRNHQDNPFVSAGLRFMNSLPTTTVEAADEVGFVVAPSTLAAKAENKDNWYKLDGGVNSIARKAVCKDAANGINVVYDTDETRTYYQLVLTGLSTENEANTAYSRRFSTVMYVKKDGVYSYYALGEASYNQVDAIAYVLGIKNY